MLDIIEAARESKLAEQEIARQVIADRNNRIEELQKRVELLETLLNRAVAAQTGVPQPQPFPAFRNVPKRWSVR